jgi:hypothetical protein
MVGEVANPDRIKLEDIPRMDELPSALRERIYELECLVQQLDDRIYNLENPE